MKRTALLMSLASAALFGCAKGDFRDNVCGALEKSGGDPSAPTKESVEKALGWAKENVKSNASRTVVGAVSQRGVDRRMVGKIIRVGGEEKAGYTGTCALADSFDKVYGGKAE